MTYKQIIAEDIAALQAICTPERVFFGQSIHDDYTHDEMVEYGKFTPDVVVEAISTEEVAEVMRYASTQRIPVTPRGSGTGLCGGAVAIHGGILLSLARMNRVLEIDEENLTATIEPGVLLMEFNQLLTNYGLFYPPDPGEKSATVGGNVMTNAGGMRAIKYGVTRDYVLGMEVVLPDGRVVELGGKLAKNSSGYSLLDLMIGSEGTLGIVTKLVLKLLAAPSQVISLLVPFTTLEQCIETVPKIIKSRVVPCAVEFMQREVIEAAEEYLGKQFPDKSADAYLLLSFDGNSAAEIETIYEQVARLCLEAGAIDVLIANTAERQESIWNARGAFLEAIKSSTMSGMDECDVVVPQSAIASFVKFVSQLERKYRIRIRSFGHAGDGNIHIYICRDQLPQEAWEQTNAAVMDELYRRAKEMGGQVSGEHGIGHAKRSYLEQSIGATTMELMRGIKQVFDPQQILNPGKVC
ncbi:MAG: FAD-binding oxidoreductase [Bacillota bacterium]